jgi:type I restriction enzyme M protein
VIVPDGVLFGSSNAHKTLKRMLVEDQKLDAVLSVPPGVFKPYAGVSTGVLVFTKTNSGGTDNVWFYGMQADGFSLDDKRTELDHSKHENDNIPDLLSRWLRRDGSERQNPRTSQSFCVPKVDIAAQGYDLSINRYKEVVHEEIAHRQPLEILAALRKMEGEIQESMTELESMLG